MDRIMPVDLDRTKLRKSFRGYETSEVDEILKVCARTIEALLADNQSLRQEGDKMRSELELKRAQEDTLKEALLLAQKTADETRAAAQKHAEAIIEEARQAALAERVAVQQKVSELRWDVERLKTERQRVTEDFRAMLEGHLRGLTIEPLTGLGVVSTELLEASA
jgi:cell division initiation protein